MADNVSITAGAGTIIATDEVSRGGVTEQEQVIKISLGAEGFHDLLLDSGQQTMANSLPVVLASNQSAIAVTDNATTLSVDDNGGALTVDNAGTFATQSTLQASEYHIGATGGNSVEVTVVPVLTVAAAYISGDYVGTSGDAMTFASCARVNAGLGIITGAVLIDYAAQSVSGELWLFDTEPTPPADSAAWSLSDAHCARCIGVIPFSTYYASALNSVSPQPNLSIPFKCIAESTALYGCFVTRGTPAYASGDLTFRLYIAQD